MTADPYSFRPPKGAKPMKRSVAEAIGAAAHPGVSETVDDPRAADVIYLICDRLTWAKLQAAAARHSGNQRSGDRRRLLFNNPEREK